MNIKVTEAELAEAQLVWQEEIGVIGEIEEPEEREEVDNVRENTERNLVERIDEEEVTEEILALGWTRLKFIQITWPVFITALLFIQCGIYLMIEMQLLVEYTDVLVFNPDNWDQPWRYFTVVFIHLSYDHLVSNMLKQLQYGILLELKYGWRQTSLVYFIGAGFGTLFHHICFLGAGGMSAGSSSAIKALLCAYLPPILLNWRHHFEYHDNRISTALRILVTSGLASYIVISCFLDFLYSFKSCYLYYFYNSSMMEETAVSSAHHTTSHPGHLGGCIGGLIAGAFILSSSSSSSSSPSTDDKRRIDANSNNNISNGSNDSVVSQVYLGLEQNAVPLITLISIMLPMFI